MDHTKKIGGGGGGRDEPMCTKGKLLVKFGKSLVGDRGGKIDLKNYCANIMNTSTQNYVSTIFCSMINLHFCQYSFIKLLEAFVRES